MKDREKKSERNATVKKKKKIQSPQERERLEF